MIIIPGINGSDQDHWQTLWQRNDPLAIRIEPSDWDAPQLEDWLAALGRALADCKEPPLLLAHSLGCLLVAFWAARHPSRYPIRGAYLVAPPDPEEPHVSSQCFILSQAAPDAAALSFPRHRQHQRSLRQPRCRRNICRLLGIGIYRCRPSGPYQQRKRHRRLATGQPSL